MLRLSLIIISCFLVSSGICQSLTPVVVSTGGGSYQNTFSKMDITIGETITETIGNSDYILTQGFQQGHYRVTDIETILADGLDIKVFPNPTNGILNICFDSEKEANYQINLYSTDGKLISSKLSTGSSFNDYMNLSSLPVGTYYLEIVSDGIINRKTCKIVKE